MLYLVSTPIGNLKDITLRCLETLQSVDTIICEDTRRTSILLNHYQIKKPLLVLNDFNESKIYLEIINRLEKGENLALLSDAGTPLISDPGYKLVRECALRQIPLDSLPGPSSVIDALTLSGLPPDKFMYLGYLPEKEGGRQKVYQSIKSISQIIPTTFIFFISPFKLLKPLIELQNIFADINITLAKELTKIHQKVETNSLSYFTNQIKKTPPKGEIVLLLHLPQ